MRRSLFPSRVFLLFQSVLTAFLVAPSIVINAQQAATPASTLNLPHPDSQQGPTIGALSQSGRETINIGSGQLTAFLPVLDLPQHGGSVLHLGLVYSGNPWSVKETSVTYNEYGTANANGESWWLETYATLQWLQNQTGPFYGPLHLNLPTLNADVMYMGYYSQSGNYNPTPGQIANFFAVHCVTDWTFSDWQGATHTFNGFRDCDNAIDYGPTYFNTGVWLKQREATDGSGYQIDLTSPSDPKVIGPDGTVYHFPAYSPQPPNTNRNVSVNGYVQLNYYSHYFSSVVDTNGNSITYSTGSRTITDTVGRQIGVDLSGGFSWQSQASPGGSPYSVSTSLTQSNSGQTVAFDSNAVPNCWAKPPGSYMGGAQAAGYSGPQVTAAVAPTVYSSYTTLVNLPDGSNYELDFDSLNRLTKIRYPSGGYNRYDYQTLSNTTTDEGDMMCNRPTTVVVAKHECSSSSGSCSQSPTATQTSCSAGAPSGGEATTCYFGGSYGSSVTTPKLETIAYTFSTLPAGNSVSSGGAPGWAPHYFPPLEMSHTVYSANSSVPLQRVDTSYVVPENCPDNGEWCDAVAATTKTTFYSSSGAATGVAEHDVTIQYPDNLLTSKDLDFSGNTVRSTTNTYETETVYSASGTSGTLYHLLDRVHSSQAVDSLKGLQKTATNTHDALGNLVQVDVSATGAATVSTKVQLNSQGDITQFWDPMEFAGSYPGSTTLSYETQGIGACPQNTGPGLPTSVTNALNQTTQYAYYGVGKLACTKDANGQITMYSYDPLGRVSEVDHPDGGRTTATYTASAPLSMSVSTLQNGSQSISQETIIDGLGRTAQQILTAPEGQICSETFYDPIGNVSNTNDPRIGCLGSPAGGASLSYTYDALGRKTGQTNEDGTTVQWSYFGPTVTTTDEAGHPTQRTSDALGRLTQVLEPNAQNTPAIATNYTYDGFGNLWGVTQNGISGETARNRSFTNNGLSQLLTASNPETGTVCYGKGSGCTGGYDLNGNTLAKTDANGNVLIFQYDALNRIVSRQSSGYGGVDGVSAGFAYDAGANGVGRLTAEYSNGIALETYSYDPIGRVKGTRFHDYERDYGNASQTEQGMQVGYDLTGNPTQITYPDGRSVAQIWDTAGRLSYAVDQGTGEVYVSGGGGSAPTSVQYFPSGRAQSSVFGNGVKQNFGQNSRLQICYANASSPLLPSHSGRGNLLDREYHFSAPTGPQCSNENGNNGNIYASVDNLQPLFTQSLGYDNLNRLTTANVSDGAYSHIYNYDSFGNMVPQYSDTTMQFSADTNNRLQINGGLLGYDNAGHLVSSPNPTGGSHSFLYTADGYVRCIDNCQTGSYLYDAIGQRSYAYHSTANSSTSYVYLNGQVMSEWNDQGIWTDYIYANGQKIAKTVSQKPILHLHGIRDSSIQMNWGVQGPINGVPSAVQSYVIQSGDRLSMNFKQNIPTNGGLAIVFQDGRGSEPLSDITTGTPFWFNTVADNVWHNMVADLSAFQGTSVNYLLGGIHNSCPQGTLDMYIADVVIQTVDGRTFPLLTGQAANVQNFNADEAGGAHDMTSTVDLIPLNSPVVGTNYYLSDQVGTTQLELSGGGWPIWQGRFTPFGMEVGVTQYALGPQPADGDSNHYKFTGKERDTESGLDYFGARYYGSSMGRFMSPDPKQPSMKHLMNPQKWNKYAYVLNNPLSLFDPDGMEEMTIVYRTFIAQPTITFLGKTYQGDGRTFSTASNVSSRSSITVRIETDPSIRPGNPIISQTSSAGQSRTIDSNGNTIKSGQAQTGLPVATGSRDANGNAVIGITQDPKDPVSPVPQFMTPGVSANLSMNFTQDGSSVTTTGTASIFPSQELNVSGADGTTTPVFRFTPDPSSSPFAMYVKDRKVNCTTTGTGSTCQ